MPTNHVYVGDIFLLGKADIIKTNLSVREGLGKPLHAVNAVVMLGTCVCATASAYHSLWSACVLAGQARQLCCCRDRGVCGHGAAKDSQSSTKPRRLRNVQKRQHTHLLRLTTTPSAPWVHLCVGLEHHMPGSDLRCRVLLADTAMVADTRVMHEHACVACQKDLAQTAACSPLWPSSPATHVHTAAFLQTGLMHSNPVSWSSACMCAVGKAQSSMLAQHSTVYFDPFLASSAESGCVSSVQQYNSLSDRR